MRALVPLSAPLNRPEAFARVRMPDPSVTLPAPASEPMVSLKLLRSSVAAEATVNALAVAAGASIVRVHDAGAAVAVVRMAAAMTGRDQRFRRNA